MIPIERLRSSYAKANRLYERTKRSCAHIQKRGVFREYSFLWKVNYESF